MKTLFICSGNVARSQMAEGIYNHLTCSQQATSAGVDESTPMKYQRPVDEVIQVMSEEGIDVRSHRVKTVTETMIAQAERIIVLCTRDECPAFVLQHPRIEFWAIQDPFRSSIETFRAVRDAIKTKVLALI